MLIVSSYSVPGRSPITPRGDAASDQLPPDTPVRCHARKTLARPVHRPIVFGTAVLGCVRETARQSESSRNRQKG